VYINVALVDNDLCLCGLDQSMTSETSATADNITLKVTF